MKLRFGDRIFAGLMGLILILSAVGMLLNTFGILPDWSVHSAVAGAFEKWHKVIMCALCAVMILVGFYGLGMLFRRRRDKGFVIQRTEYGDMSISMKAMENMVHKCVDAHAELKANHTRIYRSRNGVWVEVKVTLPSGANIPLTVNALQKQIKQYITSCSGVDVHEVRVKVETDIARLAAPVEVPALETPAVEPAAEKICQHQEEPAAYAVPKAEPEAAAEEITAEETAVEVAEVTEEAEETVEETADAEEITEAAEEIAAEADAEEISEEANA